MRRPTLLLAALASTALAPAGTAADFTFQVPVTITNIPSASSAQILCTVSRAGAGTDAATAAANDIGLGTASFELAGGPFAKTIPVVVNATGIIPASAAKSYRCSLELSGRATSGVTYTARPNNMADVIHTATGQSLTEVQARVSGKISVP